MKKILITLVSLMFMTSVSSAANAYYLIGKVWTSTTSIKTPYAYSGNFPSGLVSAATSGNTAWNLLSGSALKTGSLSYTSSANTYANASLKLSYQNIGALFGVDSPGMTTTSVGSNAASVYLNSTWTWGSSFDKANRVAVARTVLTHEFGHAYGLDHPSLGGSMTSAEIASVMNVTYTIKNTPNSDDVAGIASMY